MPKILWKVIVIIVTIVLSVTLAVQTPMLQTRIINKITRSLPEKIQGEISIGKVHFRPFNILVIKDACITDIAPVTDPTDSCAPAIDTLLYAEYITIRLNLENLKENEGVHLEDVKIKNGTFNLVIEDGGSITDKKYNNISRIFGIIPGSREKTDKELFYIKNVVMRKMEFSMTNYSSRKTPYRGGVDWNKLDIHDIDMQASDLHFIGGIFSGTLNEMSFTEGTGFNCRSLSGHARVGKGQSVIHDFHMQDSWSDIHLPEYTMVHTHVRNFSKFTEKILIDAMLSDSHIDSRTIAHFAPGIKETHLAFTAQGGFKGTISDFRINGMEIRTDDGALSGIIDGKVSGISNIRQAKMEISLNDMRFSTSGINNLIKKLVPDVNLDLTAIIPDEDFIVDAYTAGTPDKFHIDTDIRSGMGNISGNLEVHNLIDKREQIKVEGIISTADLQVGRIIGTDIIRETTLSAEINGELAENIAKSNLTVNNLRVDRLNLNGYDYSQISGEGKFSDNSFDGRIACEDPNLNFLFQGRFGLSRRTQDALYKFYAVIGHADLNALNIDKRGRSIVTASTQADFRRSLTGDVYGEMTLDNISFENNNGLHYIDRIELTSVNRNETYKMVFNSDFLNCTFSGSAPVTEFIKDFGEATVRREFPDLFAASDHKLKGNRYSLDLRMGDTDDVLEFLIPGLKIAENTSLTARLNNRGGFNASLNTGLIVFNQQYLKNVRMSLNNNDERLNGNISSEEAHIALFKMKSNDISVVADNNQIRLGYAYNNAGEMLNMGEANINGQVFKEGDNIGLDLDILPSRILINSRQWNIEQSQLSLHKGEIDIKQIDITNGDQHISIFGKTSQNNPETLTLKLNKFDLAEINPIIGSNFDLSGNTTGEVQLTSPLKNKGILIDLICSSTTIAGEPIGTLDITSDWDEENERFNIALNNSLAGKSTIDIKGNLSPNTKAIQADIELDRFQAGYLQPMLDGIFTDVNGYITGNISVSGPMDNFVISSRDTRLDDAELTVEYTNVPYFLDGGFHIDNKGLYFDNIQGRDRYTGTAIISGGFTWNNFKDIRIDTRIRCSEMEAINLTEKQNDTFYGNAFGTGNVSFTGPLNAVHMIVDMVTVKDGDFHIPMSAVTKAGGSDLLTFTAKKTETEVKIDQYDQIIAEIEQKEKMESVFTASLHINTAPLIDAFIEIDKNAGHVLRGNGNGKIIMEIAPDIFDITGDYTLTGGNYRFVALGVVNRDFEIRDGSSITFNGDIMESDLNIDALYKTKVALSTLIADTTSVANRHTVECGINITGKLRNPRLAFSIDIPDLDPTIESRVNSALSTEDKVQKQFLSLLLSGSFVPDEQSGIFNNSTMIFSNITEIMAGQVNNMLQRLNIPVDLGLNYQPNEKGNDVFDVDVSTQMFDNRVIVNGSVGNKQYSSGGQTDVVGDLDIEIKIDKSGAFRLNLFSHSADSYTNYLDNSQRNGVGITYQNEFNSWSQFLKNMFSNKKKRQETKREEEQAIIDGERIKIQITE